MFSHSIKRCSIYIILAFAVVLSACSIGCGSIGAKESERYEQGNYQPGQLIESVSLNSPQPSPTSTQPDQKIMEQLEPTEREEENKLIPEVAVPELKFNPDFRAPEKYQHPLQTSSKLIFMLGQDDNGFYLYAEGVITDGDFNKFKRYVAHYQKNGIILKRLMMHSPGGMLAEGIQIGQFIRNHQWATDLDRHMRCYSSCAMIYAAGVEKRMQEGAELGFHRPYIPGEPDTPELVNQIYQDYQQYWSFVQADQALYDNFMKNYGRDEMLLLTTETATQYLKIGKY